MSTKSTSNRCSKCGTIKKYCTRSCCARGGAWFKNCGGDGDSSFDHTWNEGIQACNDFESSIQIKPPVQVMLRHMGVIIHPITTVRLRSTTIQQKHEYGTVIIPNMDTTSTDSDNCVGPRRIVITYTFFIILFFY